MNRRGLMLLVLSTMVMPSVLLLCLGCNQTGGGSENANVFEQLKQKTLTKRIAASSYPLVAMTQSIAGEDYEVWMPSKACLLYTSPSPRDSTLSRMPSSA